MIHKKKDTFPLTLERVSPQASFQFVEAYRSLRTNLEYLPAATGCKTIVVTSSLPQEGKSSISYDLAQTLANANKRVILLDGDLRKGTLTRYLHVSREHSGLSDMLAGTAEWDKAQVPLEGQELILVPTGRLPQAPPDLLLTPRMAELMQQLRDMADYVIIDTPPVSVVTDAAILGHMADGVILVVRSGMVTIQEAQFAKKQLEAVGAHILGVVLNGCEVNKRRRKAENDLASSCGDDAGDDAAAPAPKA